MLNLSVTRGAALPPTLNYSLFCNMFLFQNIRSPFLTCTAFVYTDVIFLVFDQCLIGIRGLISNNQQLNQSINQSIKSTIKSINIILQATKQPWLTALCQWFLNSLLINRTTSGFKCHRTKQMYILLYTFNIILNTGSTQIYRSHPF